MNDATGVARRDLAEYVGDEDLLRLALTHRSYVAESTGESSNERLEFLGDAVLSLVVAEHLHETFVTLDEGDLTRIRSAVVRSSALAPAARLLAVGCAVRLGRGEARSGGQDKDSILADTLEALIGATYLSKGLDGARRLIFDALGSTIDAEAARSDLGDAKNRLQEMAVRLFMPAPIYCTDHSGPDHARVWVAKVMIGDEVVGQGEGVSRRSAESAAAEQGCRVLSDQLL